MMIKGTNTFFIKSLKLMDLCVQKIVYWVFKLNSCWASMAIYKRTLLLPYSVNSRMTQGREWIIVSQYSK
jgi:hypothetical protein